MQKGVVNMFPKQLQKQNINDIQDMVNEFSKMSQKDKDSLLHEAIKNEDKLAIEILSRSGAKTNDLDIRLGDLREVNGSSAAASAAKGTVEETEISNKQDMKVKYESKFEEKNEENSQDSIVLNLLTDSTKPLEIYYNPSEKAYSPAANGFTALMHAASNGHKETVDTIISKYPDTVKDKDNNGWTALMHAASNGHKETVDTIISKHSDTVKDKDKQGWTALMHAASNGHKETVDTIISNHPDTVKDKDKQGWTALMHAASNGHKETVDTIISNHPDTVKDKDKQGWTALMLAAQNGHKDIVDTIINTYPDTVKATDYYGRTALMIAAQNGHKDVVDTIISKYPDTVKARINEGWIFKLNGRGNEMTALMIAAEEGHKDIVDTIISKYPDTVEATDYYGRTALMIAAGKGHKETVDTIISKYPDTVEAKNNDVYSALMLAIRNEHKETVETIISKYPDTVEAKRDTGYTALMAAAQNRNKDVAETIISKYPDTVEAKTNKGYTALMLTAYWRNNKDVAELLINLGADLSKTDLSHVDLAGLRNPQNRIQSMKSFTDEKMATITSKLTILPDNFSSVKKDVKDTFQKLSNLNIPDYVNSYELGGINKKLLSLSHIIDSISPQNDFANIANEFNKKFVELRNTLEGIIKSSSFLDAAKKGNKDIVATLVRDGANIEAKNNDGNTALMFAAKSGHKETAELLINLGSSVSNVSNRHLSQLGLNSGLFGLSAKSQIPQMISFANEAISSIGSGLDKVNMSDIVSNIKTSIERASSKRFNIKLWNYKANRDELGKINRKLLSVSHLGNAMRREQSVTEDEINKFKKELGELREIIKPYLSEVELKKYNENLAKININEFVGEVKQERNISLDNIVVLPAVPTPAFMASATVSNTTISNAIRSDSNLSVESDNRAISIPLMQKRLP